MKKTLVVILGLILFSSQSLKAEGSYVGIDYLNNKIDTGITNISSTLDETDSGYSLFYGTEFTENLDIEASYQDFGEASLSGVSGNQFSLDGTTYEFNTTATLAVKATSIGFAAKPKMEVIHKALKKADDKKAEKKTDTDKVEAHTIKTRPAVKHADPATKAH